MQRRRDPVPGPFSILASFLLALLILPSAGCSGGDCTDVLMYLTVDCTGDDEGTSPTPTPRPAPKGTVSLANAEARFLWNGVGDQAVMSVAPAGDVNGDGYADIIVGARQDNTAGDYAGAAYLLLGPLHGTLDPSAAAATLLGEAAGDGAGASVASAGDVNGDEYADLLIGAPGSGAAYLFLGPVSGTRSLAAAYMKLVAPAGVFQAGTAVAGVGNAGGKDSTGILVSAFQSNENYKRTGLIYLVTSFSAGTKSLSTAEAVLVGSEFDDAAGRTLATAGDVNGDGYDDILIGAYASSLNGDRAGAAYLLNAPFSGSVSLADANTIFLGVEAQDTAGGGVSSAGDVNGDGNDDILIGTHMEGNNGGQTAYLVYGPKTGTMSLADADATFTVAGGGGVGYSVAGAGDVNGDGIDDVIIGAIYSNAAYLLYGPIPKGDIDLASADVTFQGEDDRFGTGFLVAGAGDVNGDGYDDVLIVAYQDYYAKAGIMYLVYGGKG